MNPTCSHNPRVDNRNSSELAIRPNWKGTSIDILGSKKLINKMPFTYPNQIGGKRGNIPLHFAPIRKCININHVTDSSLCCISIIPRRILYYFHRMPCKAVSARKSHTRQCRRFPRNYSALYSVCTFHCMAGTCATHLTNKSKP